MLLKGRSWIDLVRALTFGKPIPREVPLEPTWLDLFLYVRDVNTEVVAPPWIEGKQPHIEFME